MRFVEKTVIAEIHPVTSWLRNTGKDDLCISRLKVPERYGDNPNKFYLQIGWSMVASIVGILLVTGLSNLLLLPVLAIYVVVLVKIDQQVGVYRITRPHVFRAGQLVNVVVGADDEIVSVAPAEGQV